MHNDSPSNCRTPIKTPTFQDLQASLKNGRYPLTLDMSRLWIEDFLALHKCELVTLSITKNHRCLESPRLGRKSVIKHMLSLDPTEVMCFDNVAYLLVDLETHSNPSIDDLSNQTLTLPEFSKSCTKSGGGGVAFR